MQSLTIDSPLGPVTIMGTEEGICGVAFGRGPHAGGAVPPLLPSCARALGEYFAGRRRTFDHVPLRLEGTPFAKKVWTRLRCVPAGATITYGELATMTGHPRAARAAGRAVARNPLAILIPCHRVVPAGAGRGGYAWGKRRKAWLLRHERRER